MEDFSRQQEKKKLFEFEEVIEERVTDVGAQKGATMRQAQNVTQRLFERFSGDASKVTDEDIASAFDTLDKTD